LNISQGKDRMRRIRTFTPILFYHFGTSAIYTPTGDRNKKLPPSFICATCAHDTEYMAL
jgi:hypothetical protein